MVAEVLHPVDVDSYIGCPVESLNQSPGSIVHTHPGNDLETMEKRETNKFHLRELQAFIYIFI